MASFDLLAAERDHFYAVDAYMLDVTLLAPHTLGPPLARQLDAQIPTNVILTGELLARLRQSEPATWDALQKGVSAGYVGLLGGESIESRADIGELRDGPGGVSPRLGRVRAAPRCASSRAHARRRFGVSVLYPQLLHRLGYNGALHTALAAGRYPEGSQVKIRWQGPDHTSLDTIGRQPLDAARPETFLCLASKLGETMDMDHVATLSIAHWPGHVSPWYDDLRRVAKFGAMLGKFVTIDQYLKDTDYPGTSERFQADQYQSPYLAEAAAEQSDPISSSVRDWRRDLSERAGCTLETLVTLATNRLPAAESG